MADINYKVAKHEDVTALQDEFTTYKDSNNLKVAKVEKDLNDYQKTLSQVNVNQEAKQIANGYGIVSLPKNAAEGQISVTMKGNTYTNFVKNGNFSQGTTGWVGSGATLSATNNTLSVVGTGVSSSIHAYQTTQLDNVADKKVYVRAKVKVTNNVCSAIQLYPSSLGSGYTNTPVVINNPLMNQVYIISCIGIAQTTDSNKCRINIRHLYADAATANGKVLEVQEVIAIDLTATFGAGNEPTKEQCDKIFANWFDGTKSTVSASRLKSVGKNLFEPGINGWIKDGAGELTYDNGTYYYKRTSGSNYDIIYKLYKVKPNTNFVLSYNLLSYTVGHGMRVCDGDITGTVLSQDISTAIGRHILAFTSVSDTVCIAFRGHTAEMAFAINDVQLEQGTAATPYEPYTESTQYITAKDEEGNTLELRSLPNGVKDEVSIIEGVKTQNVSDNIILPAFTLSDLISENRDGVDLYRKNCTSILVPSPANWVATHTGAVLFSSLRGIVPQRIVWSAGVLTWSVYTSSGKNYVDITVPTGETVDSYWGSLSLTYQLAEPIITPIQVSGTLLSNPNGSVYVEPVVADAGIYDEGISVLHQDLPIDYVEKLSRVDFTTGLETELDVSKVAVSEDRTSFTHPDLVDGDIVFFTYHHDMESAIGETIIEYYDSRYVLKDDVTGKFYKVVPRVSNGELINDLVEV